MKAGRVRGARQRKRRLVVPKEVAAHFPPSGQKSVLLVIPKYTSRPARLHGMSYMAGTLTNQALLGRIARASPIDLPETPPSLHVRILDLGLTPKNFNLAKFLKRFSPTILGVTATTPTFRQAVSIAHAAKISVPEALRVVGGYHASGVPGDTLQTSPFQVAAVGYGEETMSELAMCLHHYGREALFDFLEQIPGISYKGRGGKIAHNQRRSEFLPLDDLPFPHTVFPLYIYGNYAIERDESGERMGFMLGARGCPFTCRYCSGEVVHQKRLRFRSPENILSEIAGLRALGINRIMFDEETFTLHPQVEEVVASLGDIKGQDPRFKWGIETRGDRLDPGLLERMADAGLYNMAFGVETGDERLAREVKNDPRLSMATLIANTQAAQERGVSVAYNLLVGLPGQDWASILQTALLLRNHPPDRAGAADYSFYPGSHYYETLTKNGEASIKRYDGALAEIDMPHMTRGEILSAVTDLEVLFYYLRQAKAHPEAAETFLETLSWHVIDKLRIWTIYDLFLTSTATRDSRADLLRKLGKSADPILGQLLSERTKKTATFMAMAARMDEITLFEQYEQYSRAINLAPQVKGDYLDSFLTNISFVNALALIRLPFGVIRLWVMICMELYHSLKENDDLNIKSIELEDGKRGAALIQAKLLGKNTADLNRAQLTKGESVIEFMGIPFRLDRQEGRLVIPI